MNVILGLIIVAFAIFMVINEPFSGLFLAGFGLVYLAIGVFFFLVGRYIYKASNKINTLQKISTQNEYNELTIEAISALNKYAKFYGIYFIVSFVLGLFFVLFYVLFLAALVASLGTSFAGTI